MARQKSYLSEKLAEETLPELLLLCARQADTTPLLFLIGQARARQVRLDAELGHVFLQLSTSALQKLLQLPGLLEPAALAWKKASVDQLVSFALLDRYLRRGSPAAWRSSLDSISQAVENKIKNKEEPDESLILRLEGKEQKRLQAAYPRAWEAWGRVWEDCSQRAIQHLASRPRGVSLANAEKLLSQQVYTDQGHFILELLQNADDAGASEFEVRFAHDSITVIHDGVPFDFRDLVGVLSIGQTTKTERQIGYFGVGFKSVFEVTERPSITSGHFAFEIIDISIPRFVASKLDPEQKTVLVLPMKEGLQVEPYFQRALEIEQTLLLNLPHVKTLRWQAPDGSETVLSQSRDGALHSLTKDDTTQSFLVWEGDYRHAGQRPEGKPDRAKVMLAFPQDDQSEEGLEQNLYSFLPIQEDSGLRFLIGSHFDVPVDRERLDQTSPWNRGLIGLIPSIIGRECEADPDLVMDLLPLLPLPQDSVGPLFANLSRSIMLALKNLPFLRQGKQRTIAAKVQVPEPSIAELFHPEERDDFTYPRGERQREWLNFLGARTFDLKALLLDLTRAKTPLKLQTKDLEAWTTFHKLLLQSPSFESWEEKLRAVPLFIDNYGELASARALCHLPEEWKEIFREPPRTIWSELLQCPETETLMASLRVRTLEWKDLLQTLHQKGLSNLNLEALIEQLSQAPKTVQIAFFRLPLFTDLEGRKTALAAPRTFGPGALITDQDTPIQLFEELSFCTQSTLIEPLLEAYGWPRFDRSAALRYLYEKSWTPSPGEAAEFRRWLLNLEPEWATIEDIERLSALPLFESSNGTLAPLKKLWNYRDEALADLLPDLPQLRPDSDSEKLVSHFRLEHRLGQADLATLIEHFDQADSKTVLTLLSSKAQSLSREQISRFLSRPLVNGRPVAYGEWLGEQEGIEVADPSFVELFLELCLEVADPEYTTLLAPLMDASGYKMLGLKRLIEVLQAQVPKPATLPKIYKVLVEKSIELYLGYSQQVLRTLAIWQCEDGEVRSADEIPPNQEVAKLFELEGHQAEISPPDELIAAFALPDPLEFIVEFVRDKVRPNRPLFEQPSWFNTVTKVDAVSSYLTKHVLCVDIRETVRDTRLLFAPLATHVWLSETELLHPDSSQEQVNGASPMLASKILRDFLPRHKEAPCRRALYEYLKEHLGHVVREPKAKEILLQEPIWLSSGNQWRRLEEMVLESEQRDLGFDWYPHPEIPKSLLEQLQLTLDVGRPDPKTLFITLLPAYKDKVLEQGQAEDLMQIMAKVSEPLTGQELRSAVRQVYGNHEFLLEGQEPLSQAYAPPPGLRPLQAVTPQPEERLRFLRKLGLPYLPSVAQLRACNKITSDDAEALASLVTWMWEERAQELEDHLGFLSQWPWIKTKAGDMSAPIQLYIPNSEVEELIGDSPQLFPHNQMPLSLFRALGFRDENNVELPHALSFLKSRIQQRLRVGVSFYYYLDQSLGMGTISPDYLASTFRTLPWIWTDEGEYRNHQEVLGFPAYRYFGPYRGTWERANSRFPTLTSLFQIPEHLSPHAILEFFQQLASGAHPDCPPRILVNGLAFLSQTGTLPSPDWRVLLAREFPTHETQLVSAAQQGVFRSNSPTLASLFGQGGTLYVVETDDPEHGQALATLYERLGIPKLRNSYTVQPHDSGSDITDRTTELVVQFRTLLRAIDRVLPRLRAARPEWVDGEWLSESQLRPFTTTASIRVIDGLQLLYRLPNVSTVLVEAAIAFDPDERRLLVSSEAVADPQRYAVELAEGLSDCIYQGQGSENLVDLLNLLLLFGSEDQMNAYLDQRHFPRPFDNRESGDEPWRKRLGEILDYGLHRALERRFPELDRARWQNWRDPNWLPAEPSISEFLRCLGVESPSAELIEAFAEMMESEEVSLPSQEGQLQIVRTPSKMPEQTGESSSSQAASALQPEKGRSSFSSFRERLAQKFSNILNRNLKFERSIALNEELPDVAESYRHPPEHHILYSDNDLKDHNKYCLSSLCSNFDSKSQRYVEGWTAWKPIFLPSGKIVQFSGSPTSPSFPLPVPLHSRMVGDPVFESSNDSIIGPNQLGLYEISGTAEAGLSYNVELSLEPEYRHLDRLDDVDPRLISTTVMLDQLPADIRKWIDWAKRSGLPHWQLADRATEFVRASYKYDLSYTKSEAVHAIHQQPVKRGENRFLQVLHAGRGGSYLGRGVCTEISAILLEMLRHSGVPSVIGAVWMLDQGLIHLPDHVIVLALVPSSSGPYLMALEPSIERISPTENRGAADKTYTRLELLEMAAKLLLPGLSGIPNSSDRRQRFLQDELLGHFGHSDLLETYLECLAKPSLLAKELSPELRELYNRGYLDIAAQELYEIRVKP